VLRVALKDAFNRPVGAADPDQRRRPRAKSAWGGQPPPDAVFDAIRRVMNVASVPVPAPAVFTSAKGAEDGEGTGWRRGDGDGRVIMGLVVQLLRGLLPRNGYGSGGGSLEDQVLTVLDLEASSHGHGAARPVAVDSLSSGNTLLALEWALLDRVAVRGQGVGTAVVLGLTRDAASFPLSALERYGIPSGQDEQQQNQRLDERVEWELRRLGTACWHRRTPYAFVLTQEGAAVLLFDVRESGDDADLNRGRSARGRNKRKRSGPSDRWPTLGVRYVTVPSEQRAGCSSILKMPLLMSLWALWFIAWCDPDRTSWNGHAAQLNTWRTSMEGGSRWHRHAWLPQRNMGHPPGARVIQHGGETTDKTQGRRKRKREDPTTYADDIPDAHSGFWSDRLRPRKRRPNYRD
jgi:hypothetical protein